MPDNPPPLPPLALTDAELDCIMQVSRPLSPADRISFLEIVAERLRGRAEIGEGALWRICVEAQRKVFRPPDLAHASRK
jgi:hypothetical protein